MSSIPFIIRDYDTFKRNEKDFDKRRSYATIDSVDVPFSSLHDRGNNLFYNEVAIFPESTFYGVVDTSETLEEKGKAEREKSLKRNTYTPDNPYPPIDLK